MEYTVVGASRETGEDVEFKVSAGDALSAQDQANRMGILVKAVRAGEARAAATPEQPQPEAERRIAEYRSSLLDRIVTIIVLAIIPLVGWVLIPLVVLECRSRRYELTTERLIVTTGILSKRQGTIELFRVKDVHVTQGIIDRLVNVGRVLLISSDPTSPRLVMPGVPNPVAVAERVRAEVKACRRASVRNIDAV